MGGGRPCRPAARPQGSRLGDDQVSDIKLFRLGPAGITELPGEAVQVEKSLQTLFEHNLDALLGVCFLASEHSTGPFHGGRIDTLGLDEDASPVIIEYKRAVNENVINQAPLC